MLGRLTARKVQTAKPGKYSDGGGLYLAVAPNGRKKWTCRFTWKSKAREAGLGSADTVSLADARAKALEYRRAVKIGIDPIQAARKAKGVPTFGDVADELIEAKQAEWRNDKHRAQWRMTLIR